MLHFTVVSGAVTSIHFSPIYMSITLSWSFSWVLFKPKSTLLSLEPIILFYTTQLKSIFFFFFFQFSGKCSSSLSFSATKNTERQVWERDTHTKIWKVLQIHAKLHIYSKINGLPENISQVQMMDCWMENKCQSSISTALDNFSKFKLYIYIYISAIQKVYIRQGRQKKS